MDVKNKKKPPAVFEKTAIALRTWLSPTLLIYPVNFAATFLLSRGVILGSASPFGLAASAVVGGAERGTVFGLLGAVFGYLSVIERINSLKYIACIILIFTAHFVFSGTSISKKRSFAPISVIVPSMCINLVFLADSGFPIFDTALGVFEVSLAAICTIFFSYVTHPQSRSSAQFSIGLLALIAAAVIPLCDLMLFETISLGRMFAFTLVLLSAFTGGIGAGSTVGIVLGFAVSLSCSSPDFCMLYGILGICSGIFSGKSKYIACVLAVPFALFAAVCLNPSSLIARAAELAIASAAFLTFANIFSRYARKFFIKSSPRRDIHIRTYAAERLNLAANTFRSLSKILNDSREKSTPHNHINEKSVFERTSREICKKCTLAKICWERDFEATRDAINNAGNAIRKNGTLSAKDFPIHFSSRCLHIENFVNSVNREIFAMRYRNQFDGRLRESQDLITRQYSDASAIFSSISADISDNARFDEDAEIALRDLLASNGILCDTAVYRDHTNHINIHLCGKDLSSIVEDFEKFKLPIYSAVGARVSAPQYTRGEKLDDIVMRETPPLRGVFGAAVKRRCGSEISGDSGSFFRPSNGRLAVLLSDGMGSGKLAASESASSVSLLEGLLKSGVSPQSALCTLQTALTLKSEYTGAFSTLDLMYADMFTGCCDFYKFGGAPTYIKRGRHIRRITSSSLPAGMSVGRPASPDKTSITLKEGDFIIMTSDGCADGNDDAKLLEFISHTDENSPKALADALIAYSLAVYGKNDDMTAAVVKIEREE